MAKRHRRLAEFLGIMWHWLWLDLLATPPFGLLLGITPLGLLRFSKLARVMYLMREWRRHAVHKVLGLRLAFFAFWLGLIAHWLACGWLVLGGSLALGGQPAAADGFTQYLHALYWCVTTLTTIGYGDITPSTNVQIIYTMVVMVLGVAMYGYVIGNVANLLANRDLAKAHYTSNMERLSSFLNYRHVPINLQRRVYDYYAYLWEIGWVMMRQRFYLNCRLICALRLLLSLNANSFKRCLFCKAPAKNSSVSLR